MKTMKTQRQLWRHLNESKFKLSDSANSFQTYQKSRKDKTLSFEEKLSAATDLIRE
jgi:hypothetical protein